MLQGFRRRLPHPTRIVSGPIRKLCRHRASKRWSALLTQTRSRIGHHFGMRARLGEANWEAFVRYAVTHHKAAFLLALLPANGVVCCAGKIDGTPCPHAATLALTNLADVTHRLETFHMDHTHDAAHVCQVWSDALPPDPKAWDDGLCGPLIAQLLFGIHDHPMADIDPNPLWKAQLVVRCGNRKGAANQRATHFCHDVAHAHYTHTLTATDLRMPGDATADTTTNSTTNNETSDETSDETSNETSGDVTQAPIEVVDEVDLTLEDGTNEDNAIDLTI